MKFLLINATKGFLFFSNRKKENTIELSHIPPLGLLYIARSLEDEGHSVEIIDFYNERNPFEKIRDAVAPADVVGFTVYVQNYVKIAEIADEIKKIKPNIPIIIGGPHCTFHPEKALIDVPAADISVEGEGERVIKDIAKALDGRKKLSTISGVYYREHAEIKKGKPAEIINDLDSIPTPSRHLVDKYHYGKVNKVDFYKQKVTSMATSRGCPFQCRFCSRHVMPIRIYRQRSAENVVEEFKEINERYGSVIIVDDNFLADKKRAHKIMDRLIESGTHLEIYILGARVDSADRGLYIKMKKAGVKHIQFGIESGNQEILDFYKKNVTLRQIRDAVNLASEMNFLIVATFIFGAPIENEQHIKQTMKFVNSLPLDIALFSPLFYEHGSDLWIEAEKQNKIKKDDQYIVSADSRRGLGNFTSEELLEFCKIAFKKFYLRPQYLMRSTFKSIMRKDLSLIKIGMKYL